MRAEGVRKRTPDAATWMLAASALVAVAILTVVGAVTLLFGHREGMETGLFAVVVAALVPAALVLARRQLDRIDPSAARPLALMNVGAAASLVVLARCASLAFGADAASTVFVIGGASVLLANLPVCLDKAPVVGRRVATRRAIEIFTGFVVVAALLAFFPKGFFTPARFISCAVVAASLFTFYVYVRRSGIKPTKAVVRIIDGVILLVTILMVVDIRPSADSARYDYDFLLGPANAIAHGHAMLVETFSQYGVGMPIALAGLFHVLPLTYGGLQALLCIGYAIEFALVYSILRVACRSQFIAVTGLMVAMVANLVLPGYWRMGYASIGPLRFGIPWLIVLAGTLGARPGGASRRVCRVTMLLVLAAASVWSLETFVYSAGTYLAIVLMDCALDDGEPAQRIRAFARAAAIAGVVSITSIAAFTVLTRTLAGAWPDWGTYLGLVATYSVHGFGTLPIAAWSPGYAIASIYAISIVGLVVVVATRTVGNPRRTTLTAIAGATAYGILSFTYFLGRSSTTNLHHVAIPAVVAACCWGDMLRTMSSSSRRLVILTGTAFVAFATSAVLTQSPAWTSEWVGGSVLGQSLRSPALVGSETRDLFSRTSTRPEVTETSRLITRYQRNGPVAVLLDTDLLTSALLASGSGNALPIVNGNQDILFATKARELVRRALDRMPMPAYVLTEESLLRGRPRNDTGSFGDAFIALALSDVRRRLDAQIVERGPGGLVVLELRRNPGSASGPS